MAKSKRVGLPRQVTATQVLLDAEEEERSHQEAVTGALVLLLSDLPPDRVARALRVARPDMAVMSNAELVRSYYRNAVQSVHQALGLADGSSGLGALAAKNLNATVLIAAADLNRLGEVLGIK
jgi:hypothetical protein